MSKSKDNLQKFKEWQDNQEYNFYDDLKEQTNLTLEDVEELIKEKIKEYKTILTRTSDIYMEAQIDELKELLTDLPSLKL